MPAPDIQSEQLEEAAPPRKRIKIRMSSASKAVVEGKQASVGVEAPPTIHEDDLRQVLHLNPTSVLSAVSLHRPSPSPHHSLPQVELMLHSFQGSPALDKVAYVCPGAGRCCLNASCARSLEQQLAGNMRVRALRRFIKASLAQNGHIVSKVWL